jgi:hypothetical protein
MREATVLQPCGKLNRDYNERMKKLALLVVCALLLALGSSCTSPNSGNREFIPGKGWVPT